MKITNHAKKRLRQRTKGKTKHKKQLVKRALHKGIGYSDARGACKEYIAFLYNRGNRRANNIRLLDDKVYIIDKYTLLTVLNLPERYREEVAELVRLKGHYFNNSGFGGLQETGGE